MNSKETVSLIEVDVLNRTFCMYGDMGACEEILCDTPDQFINLLKLVRKNKDNTEVVYVSN
jgi:hypothetical protein|tara:strand:- start:21863 stop:22045 length:183 start_codon:yes stop_codon:yes gene_type:complete